MSQRIETSTINELSRKCLSDIRERSLSTPFSNLESSRAINVNGAKEIKDHLAKLKETVSLQLHQAIPRPPKEVKVTIKDVDNALAHTRRTELNHERNNSKRLQYAKDVYGETLGDDMLGYSEYSQGAQRSQAEPTGDDKKFMLNNPVFNTYIDKLFNRQRKLIHKLKRTGGNSPEATDFSILDEPMDSQYDKFCYPDGKPFFNASGAKTLKEPGQNTSFGSQNLAGKALNTSLNRSRMSQEPSLKASSRAVSAIGNRDHSMYSNKHEISFDKKSRPQSGVLHSQDPSMDHDYMVFKSTNKPDGRNTVRSSKPPNLPLPKLHLTRPPTASDKDQHSKLEEDMLLTGKRNERIRYATEKIRGPNSNEHSQLKSDRLAQKSGIISQGRTFHKPPLMSNRDSLANQTPTGSIGRPSARANSYKEKTSYSAARSSQINPMDSLEYRP